MDAISERRSHKIEPTEREADLARRYLNGEYTDVQFNYLAHQCGSDRDRMERIVEKMATDTPMANAAKFLIGCIILHFFVCAAYSLLCL